MKKIIWEHADIYFDQMTKSFKHEDVQDNNEYSDEESKNDALDLFEKLNASQGKMINTPFGLYDVEDPLSIIKRTELRIGNANFNITKKIALIINNVDGVDAFKVLSRYSFIIGIGKAFNFTDVRKNIEKALNCHIQIPAILTETVEKLKGQKYSIFLFPNGNFEVTKEGDPDFEIKKEEFAILKEELKGTVIEQL